jgi:Concanavalin A-like lectin/glucanases superfamily/VanZ like family
MSRTECPVISSSIPEPSLRSDGWLRFRLLPLAIALIAITTMVPVGLRHPSLLYMDVQVMPFDVTLNLLLYVPLGIALAESSFLACLLSGLALSLCAETLQLGYLNRGPSPVDVVTNTLGTLLGFAIAHFLAKWIRIQLNVLAIPRRLAKLSLVIATVWFIALVSHRTIADFSNWDPSFSLAIGNEVSGNRPWLGTISRLEIYPASLDPSLIQRVAQNGPAALRQSDAKAIFSLGPEASSEPAYGTPLLLPQQEQTFFRQLVDRGQISVLVWLRTGNLNQTGPARIVTYSRDNDNRNFTLSQTKRTLNFRLRTPVTGDNGTDPDISSPPLLSLGRTFFVAAVYDGATSRIYVNGVAAGEINLSVRRPAFARRLLRFLPPGIPVRELELNISEFFLGALFTLGLISVRTIPQHRPTAIMLGAIVGAACGLAVWALAASEPWLGIRILLLSIAGGLVVALALRLPIRPERVC